MECLGALNAVQSLAFDFMLSRMNTRTLANLEINSRLMNFMMYWMPNNKSYPTTHLTGTTENVEPNTI